ncbi:ethanolamine ammonia-lyase subunit EutC [Siccirubricoccus sp. KC 17139]|uniref:Ethanolamine ammonia-lyase small subunit n=1 Tax=Siccirubricoccus soli TaxID=2899147 RepID=A0ABT1D9V0_9PROT|nr:ethanolamine ammonia-lyase subunit EutC [Siccirubricoccus soli]MCO6418681.1 ethanolamine ammonia-lyase subunit EutC [Siccirubricoccus soli]MCP2684816.1 ethanolamine ammonia-lyase subunit EutC [Siccirubricoccus soli]
MSGPEGKGGEHAPPPARWADLRRFTAARVALGRVGDGMPTAAHLAFQEAHARARDAVHATLDVVGVAAAAESLGLPVVAVASQAADRRTFLLRPDLGRRLRAADRGRLPAAPGAILFVVADGLCASGVAAQAPAFLAEAVPLLRGAGMPVAPIIVAAQGRVALGDEIGGLTGAAMVAMLIGERPGLTATESMGLYLTFAPRPGRTDAERNCISNIRDGGMSARAAAEKLLWLAGAALRLGATGVALKDEQPATPLLPA